METTSIIDDHRTAAARIGESARQGGDWAAPSPCEGWTAADVLDHLIDTERDFLERFVTLPAVPSGEPAARWEAHLAALDAVLSPELLTQGFDGYFGYTTVAQVWREFYCWDLLVHRWDLGTALGQEVRYDEDELDRIEREIPEPGEAKYDAFYGAGICRDPVPAPAAADRQMRVLARLGRSA